MLKYVAKSFDELVTPLSRNKVCLLVEVTDPDKADRIDCYPLILRGLGLDDSRFDSLERLLSAGFLVADADMSESSRGQALSVVDYFRQKSVREIARAYLFINEQLIENSGDGAPSSHDILAELPRACYMTNV